MEDLHTDKNVWDKWMEEVLSNMPKSTSHAFKCHSLPTLSSYWNHQTVKFNRNSHVYGVCSICVHLQCYAQNNKVINKATVALQWDSREQLPDIVKGHNSTE